MTNEKFYDELKNLFQDVKIVTLGDITKKIAIISKVRVNKNRTFTDYDEISLNNIDHYGNIFVSDKSIKREAANPKAINSQALQYGDLVVNQRTSKMKVGFISNNYKRVIVGNNSMIRIEFDNHDIDKARFVQLYLQLPFVQEYLSSLSTSTKSQRKILSSAKLQELPIPEYKEQLISLSEILIPRMKLLSLAYEMQENAKKLIEKYETHKAETITLNFKAEIDEDSIAQDKKDIESFMKFKRFYSSLGK